MEAVDKHGQTPLLVASAKDYESVARLLVDKGANLEAANKNGSTPIQVA